MRFAALTMAAVVVAVGVVAWVVLRDAPTAGGGRLAPAAASAREDEPPATDTAGSPSNVAPSREPAPVEREEADGEVIRTDASVSREAVVSSVQLEVVNARSGEPLRGVSVFRLRDRFGAFMRRFEPGKEFLDGERIATNAASPIEVKPAQNRDSGLIEWRSRLFVLAPGHAWAKVDVDFRRGGSVRVALEPGADLEVTTIAPEDDLWVWSQLPPRIWIYRPQPDAIEPDAERLVDERMRRFAAMDDAELERATPDGHRPTAAEVRQEVSIDLKQLRRAALWGPLVAEVAANVDEPTRVRGLEPGRYVVTLQREGASRHPQVFAETIVDLSPGTNTLTFTVPEQEDVDKVRLAGTLHFSSAWGERRLQLRFDPVCVAGATESDERSLSVGDLDPVAGSDDLFQFEVDDLRPGRYLVTSGTHDWQQVVETGAHGRDDARLEIGDPADLLIRFVDDETGRAIPAADAAGVQRRQVVVSGHDVRDGVVLKNGSGALALRVFAGAQWDEEGHEVRVRVPAGEVHMSWSSLVADGFEVVDPGRVIAHPGENELTLRLRRPASIEITFDGESEAIDAPREVLRLDVKSLDAGAQGFKWPFFGGRRLLIHLPSAGRYLVTLPSIPGCADVAPFEITAIAGETVKRTIHLVPER
jgi:hypothetical protein